VDWAAAATRDHFVRGVLHTCLTGLGYTLYTLDGDFDPHRSTELRLTRPEWHGEHSAQIWVDEHQAVRGRMVRERVVDGDEAAALERGRCADFNADFRALGDQLGAAVVTDEGYVPQSADNARGADHDTVTSDDKARYQTTNSTAGA
jgi:hypothetical protein